MPVVPLLAVVAAVALMCLLGFRLFASAWSGALMSALFAATPLVWRQLRSAPASLQALPFVAGWLVALVCFQRSRAVGWLAAAGVILGAGMYVSNASAVMMPLYLVLTIAVAAYSRTLSFRGVVRLAGAFSIAAAPFVASHLLHPERIRDTVNAYRLYDADRFNVLQGVREMTSWIGLTARSEVYFDYFNPAFLFMTGDVLLWPLAVLIPIGLYQMAACEKTLVARLAVLGFFAAPFAAALPTDPPTPGRILFMTPFAAISAVYGIRKLLKFATETQRHRKKGFRDLTIV